MPTDKGCEKWEVKNEGLKSLHIYIGVMTVIHILCHTLGDGGVSGGALQNTENSDKNSGGWEVLKIGEISVTYFVDDPKTRGKFLLHGFVCLKD